MPKATINSANSSQRKAISGVLLLNKPLGISSNQALKKVQWLLKAKKGGHTGNLDPQATGVLPLCFGEATKMASFGLEADKTYIATVQFGSTSTTGDAEGELLESYPLPTASLEQVKEVLASFVGKQQQIPPMYSALKYQGQKLYELARKGEEVERPPRDMEVYELELLEFTAASMSFKVSCSKGTYIRVLGEDIAKRLDSGGHLTALHRTQVGDLDTDLTSQLVDLEELIQLEASQGAAAVRELLLPVDYLVQHLPALNLSCEEGKRVLHGQRLKLVDISFPVGQNVRLFAPLSESASADLAFLGLGKIEAQASGWRLQPIKLISSS